MKTNKLTQNLIVFVLVAVAGVILAGSKVYAQECEAVYGGGEICIEGFDIDKDVRIKGDKDWEDKVTDVKKDEEIEFRIRIENTGDIEVDDMQMEDDLPDELIKTGEDGLTEEWDDFEPGDVQEFVIKAKIKPEEFERKIEFEKCVVNKVDITQDGDQVGSATATVCFGQKAIKELPKTGADMATVFASLGFGLIAIGTAIKKSTKLTR